MFGIIFGSGYSATLKAGAGGSGTAKAGSGGNELHHFEGNLFVAAQRRCGRNGLDWTIAHGILRD
jgi:hypothetical protein